MKRRKLLKTLEKYGCEFLRNGGDHDIYKAPNGEQFSVPRHKEVREQLASALIRSARR